jgi:hypothetical protein
MRFLLTALPMAAALSAVGCSAFEEDRIYSEPQNLYGDYQGWKIQEVTTLTPRFYRLLEGDILFWESKDISGELLLIAPDGTTTVDFFYSGVVQGSSGLREIDRHRIIGSDASQEDAQTLVVALKVLDLPGCYTEDPELATGVRPSIGFFYDVWGRYDRKLNKVVITHFTRPDDDNDLIKAVSTAKKNGTRPPSLWEFMKPRLSPIYCE